MIANGARYPRYDSVLQAFVKAPKGSGVLVLADGYPTTPTPLDDTLASAAKRELRVYVEYPASLPDVEVDEPRGKKGARAVVFSDAFGPELKPLRILEINECRFVPVVRRKADLQPWLVMARVAGFDTAVYGLPATDVHPILFELPGKPVLVAATKFSQFVTARYMPRDAWAAVWKRVLEWLAPGREIPQVDWTPVVRPSYAKEDALPVDAEVQAFRRGVAWFEKANLFVLPAWRQGDEEEPFLPRRAPIHEGLGGDGSAGMAEGLNGLVHYDGTQPINYFLRSDCMSEVTFALALSGLIDGNSRSRRMAVNLADFVHFTSILTKGSRSDPQSPAFGLIGHSVRAPSVGVYYGDDEARTMLGTAGAAGVLKSGRWDEKMLGIVLASFRTSGRLGFRGWRLDEAPLQKHGWRYFYDKDTILYQPHYEAYLWACNLWAYHKTGYKPLLERTRNGIRMMMEAYPEQWRWTNGIQQERARMLLPLAWLVRVEDTPEHREWLKRMVTEILTAQDESGAIREEIGSVGKGDFGPPKSNEAYGTNEAPLIQANGEPVSDLLYTTNFAFLGLHEAEAATGERMYKEAEDKLAQFLCRIQSRSERQAELDGAWLRAFDYKRWDYWGSNSDAGWGAWSVEAGWTQTWITSVFGMRHLQTSLWNLTADSQIGRYKDKLLPLLIPGMISLQTTRNERLTLARH
jgi:hypothetical protein